MTEMMNKTKGWWEELLCNGRSPSYSEKKYDITGYQKKNINVQQTG